MAFNWREYLHLARYLQIGGGSHISQEAAFRCAVSRAYYAAFGHARNYARDRHGFSPTYQSQDHRLVREHFRGRGRVDVARKLDNLRHWRNRCDYDDTVSNLSSLLTSAMIQAEGVINRLP